MQYFEQELGGVMVTQLAHHHEVTRQQIYGWRHELKKKGLWPLSSGVAFLPVDISDLRKPPEAHATPVFDDLERWLAMQLTTIWSKSPLAGTIQYALTRMERLRPYLNNGILELDNNAAVRGMRAIALGRKNHLFVGSEAGGKAAAIAYTLIETAKLNAIDPNA